MRVKILLIGLLVILLIGASYKPLIYKIFNDYEEVCYWYRIDTITEVKCCDWSTGYCVDMFNETHKSQFEDINCNDHLFWNRVNKTWENVTNVCLKYHLVRNVQTQ